MEGSNPIFIASVQGHLEIIKYLIKECGADLTASLVEGTWKGLPPIDIASQQSHLEIIEYLKKCRDTSQEFPNTGKHVECAMKNTGSINREV